MSDKAFKDMSLTEMLTHIKDRPPITPDGSFRNAQLVYKIVTLLNKDEYAATQYLSELEARNTKEKAAEMVAKGLQNKKNKKRIV